MPHTVNAPRQRGLRILAAALAGAAVAACPVTAFSAEPPARVALVSVALPRALLRNRIAFESAFVKGLGDGEIVAIPPAQVRSRLASLNKPELASCDTLACLAALRQIFGAPFVARAEVVSTRQRSAVTVKVLDTSDGRELAAETTECRATAPCPPLVNTADTVAHQASRKAATEIRLAAKLRAAPVVAAPAATAAAAQPAGVATAEEALPAMPAAGLPAAPAPAGLASLVPSPPIHAPAAASKRPLAPWLLLAAGGSLIVGGAVLFGIDGDGVDCRDTAGGRKCDRSRDTRLAGIVTGGLGLLGVLVGGVVLFQSSQGTSVSIGRGGAALHGTY